MTVRTQPANAIVRYALTGGDAHVATRSVFDGLDWRVAGARVVECPHTLYELQGQEPVGNARGGRRPQQLPRRAGSPAPQAAAHMATAVRRLYLVSLVPVAVVDASVSDDRSRCPNAEA